MSFKKSSARPSGHSRAMLTSVEFGDQVKEIAESGLWLSYQDAKSPPLRALPPASKPFKDSGVLFLAGEQRFYVRHNLKLLQLDIGNSEARDWLLLCDGMEITFADPSGKASPVVLRVRAEGHKFHSKAAWYTKYEPTATDILEPSMNDLIAVPHPEDRDADDDLSKSSDYDAQEGGNHSQSSTASQTLKGASVNFADEHERSGAGAAQHAAELKKSEEETVVWDPAHEGFVLETLDGKEVFAVNAQARSALVGCSQECEIKLPWTDSVDVVAGFMCVADSCLCYLFTPRLYKAQIKCHISLNIPPDVAFPVKADDVFWVGLAREKMQVRLPPPLRQVLAADSCNPHQLFDNLALQVVSRRRSSPDDEEQFFNEVFSVPSRSGVTVGSSDQCEVCIPQANLGRKHFSFVRRERSYEAVATKSKRPTYLLVGRGDIYYRPPILLRSRDVFVAGKTQIKIVYQRRGNCEVNVKNARDEVLTRCGHLESQARQLSDSGVFNRNTVGIDGQITSDALLEKLGLIPEGTEPILIILVIRGHMTKKFFLCDPLGTTVGTSPSADISFPGDLKMDGLHCRIYFDVARSRWVLEDLDSKNGTFLRLMSGFVTSGDVYLLGSALLRVFGVPAKSKEKVGFLRRIFGT